MHGVILQSYPRPDVRERALLGGVGGLSDAELLAIVIGTGTGGQSVSHVAAGLLETAGGLGGLSRLGPHGIAGRRGLGPAKAARVAAALEIGKRATLHALLDERPTVGSYDAVVRWAQPRLAGLDHEEVWLMLLDGKNGLKSVRRIAQGGLHGCALTPRDVLGPALRDAASAIILIHNHPSGDPEPSEEDFTMTRAVAAACEIVGVPLLDHVIVARGGAASMLDRGL